MIRHKLRKYASERYRPHARSRRPASPLAAALPVLFLDLVLDILRLRQPYASSGDRSESI